MAKEEPRGRQRVVKRRKRHNVERRVSLRAAAGVRVGAGAEQHLHYLEVALARRAVERAREAPPRLGGRLSRVNFAPARAKDPARAGRVGDRPPIPIAPGRA